MSRPSDLPIPFEKYFEMDNFDELSRKYFRGLRLGGNLYADPSGWIDTYSSAAQQVPEILTKREDYGRYYLDVPLTLDPYKQIILNLLSQWEGSPCEPDQVTLCPSVSAGSLIVLAALKSLGVRSVLLETPCYFATAEQAEKLHINCHFVPTYFQDRFDMVGILDIIAKHDHIAIWITQPRASLGLNQDVSQIQALLSALNSNSYLVIDEATDQTFPALLGPLRHHPRAGQLIKLKNFTKPMGLNGLRVAAIIHDQNIKRIIAAQVETFGGSIDLHSLQVVSALAGDIQQFSLMLAAANRQVVSLRFEAEKLCRGTDVKVIPLANGYIGTAIRSLGGGGDSFEKERHRLLGYFRDKATPILIGPNMYFASDAPLEFVRLNYMSHSQHVLRGLELLMKF